MRPTIIIIQLILNETTTMQRNNPTDALVKGSMLICAKLLESWVESVNNPDRQWSRDLQTDMVIKKQDFNTFAVTLPNSNTRFAFVNGAVSFFDIDQNSPKYNGLFREYAHSDCKPINMPGVNAPNIASQLCAQLCKVIEARDLDLGVEIYQDDAAGFSFRVTGDVSNFLVPALFNRALDAMQLSKHFTAKADQTANYSYLCVFRTKREYVTDALGHVTFLDEKSRNNRK